MTAYLFSGWNWVQDLRKKLVCSRSGYGTRVTQYYAVLLQQPSSSIVVNTFKIFRFDKTRKIWTKSQHTERCVYQLNPKTRFELSSLKKQLSSEPSSKPPHHLILCIICRKGFNFFISFSYPFLEFAFGTHVTQHHACCNPFFGGLIYCIYDKVLAKLWLQHVYGLV